MPLQFWTISELTIFACKQLKKDCSSQRSAHKPSVDSSCELLLWMALEGQSVSAAAATAHLRDESICFLFTPPTTSHANKTHESSAQRNQSKRFAR